MYLNHTIDHPLGAYRGTYKMDIILIFHSGSKNPSSLDFQQGGFLRNKGGGVMYVLIM